MQHSTYAILIPSLLKGSMGYSPLFFFLFFFRTTLLFKCAFEHLNDQKVQRRCRPPVLSNVDGYVSASKRDGHEQYTHSADPYVNTSVCPKVQCCFSRQINPSLHIRQLSRAEKWKKGAPRWGCGQSWSCPNLQERTKGKQPAFSKFQFDLFIHCFK